MPVELRPYQAAALEKVSAFFAAGKRAALVISPTGSGKSVLIAEACRRCMARGGVPMVTAHRAELIDQIKETLARHGVIGVLVVTVQSLLGALRRNEMPRASLLVSDETHHLAADDWGQIAAYYSGAYIMGLTATPERGDGRGLAGLFDCMVVAATIRELTAAGYLAPLKIITPGRMLDPGELAQSPVTAYLEHCGGRRAIVFAASVIDAKALQVSFEAMGIRAGVIHGALSNAQRKTVLAEHESELVPVLINVFLATEGYDSPGTYACILARGCSTQSALIQMAGRVLRPYPGKTHGLLIDLPGVTNVFGDPTEDKVYSLERGIRRSGSDARFCVVCSAMLADDHTGACPDCGAENAGPLRKPSKVVNEPLGDLIATQRGDHGIRVATLAELFKVQYAKKHKPNWARFTFRQKTGFWPTKKMIDEAKLLAG